MMRAMIIAAALVLVADAHADPLPQPKPSGPGGSCPHGYFASGSYCVPSQGAQDAVPESPNGTCPWGWTSSGSFCLRKWTLRQLAIKSRGAGTLTRRLRKLLRVVAFLHYRVGQKS